MLTMNKIYEVDVCFYLCFTNVRSELRTMQCPPKHELLIIWKKTHVNKVIVDSENVTKCSRNTIIQDKMWRILEIILT